MQQNEIEPQSASSTSSVPSTKGLKSTQSVIPAAPKKIKIRRIKDNEESSAAKRYKQDIEEDKEQEHRRVPALNIPEMKEEEIDVRSQSMSEEEDEEEG
jgi:hypothetical protein